MHGMPVGLVMKLPGTEGLPGFEWLDAVPTLKPNQVGDAKIYDDSQTLRDRARARVVCVRGGITSLFVHHYPPRTIAPPPCPPLEFPC
jgi:hypothetical protein